MTRNGCAFALPTPEPATAATAYSSSAASPPPAPGLRLLPTPVAGAFNDAEPVESWLARRDRQKQLGRNGNGIGTPLAIAIRLLPTPMASDSAAELRPAAGRAAALGRQTADRPARGDRATTSPACSPASGPAQAAAGRERLLPTPDTGTSPRGHGRRGGRPGNGHQSGKDLDAAARTLTTPGPAPGTSRDAVAWGDYEPAIRRWEHVLGQPGAAPRRTRPRRPDPAVRRVRRMDDGHPAPGDRDARPPAHRPVADHRQRRRPQPGRRRAPAAGRASRRPGRAARDRYRHAGRRVNRPRARPDARTRAHPAPPASLAGTVAVTAASGPHPPGRAAMRCGHEQGGGRRRAPAPALLAADYPMAATGLFPASGQGSPGTAVAAAASRSTGHARRD